jgi:hypothetical protein
MNTFTQKLAGHAYKIIFEAKHAASFTGGRDV